MSIIHADTFFYCSFEGWWAQTWRDKGEIAFSQIGGKIYYKYKDIEELLKKHYKAPYNRNGRSEHVR